MSQTSRDRLLLGVAALLLWQLSTAWLKLLDPQLFPEPLQVLRLLVEDRQVFLKSLLSSFTLLFWGCTLAALLSIPLGLIVGWNRRLRLAIEPATNVLGPIPPIVYIPYAIAILPTFTQSSIFIIFIGAFWPLFMNTIAGVEALEKGIVDSAKTIGVSKKSMLTKILLPGAMPHIVSGGAISMVLAFILLTAAEMIGATSGLGWYVKYFSDFADYPRVVAGIIVIGVVVLVLMTLFQRLTGYLLRWRK
ncbi:Bicarbonate transport system permease protein CmpB [Sporomusa silvacetica DSM 10669]|uniref:Bicarbonate transport system permease protein CmpB n=1 Tax=Sporomusa silvacetica DSM 10669 TaxID=1123289 RepID=A0ABZ3IHU7_9FIRM|nr:ABC transporter permease subunit [Sporomusa silvacetica]OZC21424.1 bicarbonate transport system permease protein CmpB [Sporomusa silvacetica DSM 10669]